MTVSPGDWELLAAILLRQNRASDLYGHDLEAAEVKSGGFGSNFEYQYHRNGGIEKLKRESLIDHVFIEYGDHLQNIAVRVVKGEALSKTFIGWREGLQMNYTAGRQRYRKNVLGTFVREHGKLLFEIRNGQLTYAAPEPLTQLMPSWRRV